MAEMTKKTNKKAAAKTTKPAVASAKAVAKKPPAKAKTPAAKPAARKTAAPAAAEAAKATASKPLVKTPSKAMQVSDEQRYRMVAEAAYYRAESNQFKSDPVRDWIEAESDITTLLSGGN